MAWPLDGNQEEASNELVMELEYVTIFAIPLYPPMISEQSHVMEVGCMAAIMESKTITIFCTFLPSHDQGTRTTGRV